MSPQSQPLSAKSIDEDCEALPARRSDNEETATPVDHSAATAPPGSQANRAGNEPNNNGPPASTTSSSSSSDHHSQMLPPTRTESKQRSWKETKKTRLNQDSVVFSTRICVALTICSLFILLDNPNPSERVYPDATWVYITTCIVLWLPPQHPLDSVSVSMQTLRMLLGSVVGAALSISLGSLAVLIDEDSGRALYIGCCIAVVTFGYCFLVVRYNLLPDMSASLGLFLFCISLFPFLTDHSSAWRDALFRVMNTWFGCLISLVTSLCVFPRSTKATLQRQLFDQVDLAGNCVQLLLAKASNVLSGTMDARNLTSLLETTRKGPDPDEAHEAYSEFLHDLFASTLSMDLLQQCHLWSCCYCRNMTSSSNEVLFMEADQTTSQAFLVVSTVMILDSYVQQQTLVVVRSEILQSVERLGGLIKDMLTTTLARCETEQIAETLLVELVSIRQLLFQVAKDEQETCFVQDLKDILSRPDENMPISVSAVGNELFLLQLIEQLILQSLRLHYIWIQNEECFKMRRRGKLASSLQAQPSRVFEVDGTASSRAAVDARESIDVEAGTGSGDAATGAKLQLHEKSNLARHSGSQQLQPMTTLSVQDDSAAAAAAAAATVSSKDEATDKIPSQKRQATIDSLDSTSGTDKASATSVMVESSEVLTGPGSSSQSSPSGMDKASTSSPSGTCGRAVKDSQDARISRTDDCPSKGKNEVMREDRKEEAAKFGIRMSIMVTVSSLFVLLDSPDPEKRTWPQGTWVLVSAVVVAWYPTLDTASVVHKTVERIFGTFTAAVLGWTCGLFAVLIQDDTWRMVFIGIYNAIVTFCYSLVGYRSEVYGSHQYGSFVGIFTYYIVAVPFTNGDINSWWTGLYRIVNVIIGCLIACFSALLVFPRSTRNALRRRLTQQVMEAGVSVNAVLSNEESNETRDDAYRAILADQKASKELFAVLSADPFLEHNERKRTSDFRKEAAMTLARVFRIETTAVLLENNKPNSLTMPDFCIRFGTTIEALLKMDAPDAESLSDEILSELAELQPLLLETRIRVSSQELIDNDNRDETVATMREALCRMDGSSVPLASRDCNGLLCLLLVEHLVLRALRLYYAWSQNKHCTALSRQHEEI